MVDSEILCVQFQCLIDEPEIFIVLPTYSEKQGDKLSTSWVKEGAAAPYAKGKMSSKSTSPEQVIWIRLASQCSGSTPV